jgi:hypothetical protein
MRPSQILDFHADLKTRWEDTRFANVIHQCFMVDLHVADPTDPVTADQMTKNAIYLRHVIGNHLKLAYDYRVTEDMSLLVQHFADALDDEDTWNHTMAPTEAGLVRFDRPLELVDIRGRLMKIHWMTWGPAAARTHDDRQIPITMISFWNDSQDPSETSEEYAKEMSGRLVDDVMGRWRWLGAAYTQDGAPLGPKLLELDPEVAKFEKLVNDGIEPQPYGNSERYVHALWTILNQELTEVVTEEPDRAGRRRAEKAKIPARVQVIQMRKIARVSRKEGESLVEWSHRWLVRSHPRWQACGPDYPGAVEVEPGKYRARIIIGPYWKGPEGKPLVVTDKVFSLER